MRQFILHRCYCCLYWQLAVIFILRRRFYLSANTLSKRFSGLYRYIIAIRLKTELGELDGLYYNFGSELVDLRHKDLLNDTYWSKLEEKVKVAIQDIVPYDESSVVIDRVYEDSNFQVETLRISILENGQFIGQYYCF